MTETGATNQPLKRKAGRVILKILLLIIAVIIILFGLDLMNWAVYKHDLPLRKYQVAVIEIDPAKYDWGVSLTKPSNADIWFNSNFFSTKPIGLVVIEGKKYSSRARGGGYFYALGNKISIDRFCPRYTDFASQSILWAIKNGQVNHGLSKRAHAKVLTYRTLVGQKKNGNLVFIGSKSLGVMTIKELINVAVEHDVFNAIILDGGTSVDYNFSLPRKSYSFKSLSSLSKMLIHTEEPKTSIYAIEK